MACSLLGYLSLSGRKLSEGNTSNINCFGRVECKFVVVGVERNRGKLYVADVTMICDIITLQLCWTVSIVHCRKYAVRTANYSVGDVRC
jgi:hypothetical protein